MNHEWPRIEAASDPKRIKAKKTRKRKGGKEYPTPRDLAHSVANTRVRQVIKRASCNELKINKMKGKKNGTNLVMHSDATTTADTVIDTHHRHLG